MLSPAFSKKVPDVHPWSDSMEFRRVGLGSSDCKPFRMQNAFEIPYSINVTWLSDSLDLLPKHVSRSHCIFCLVHFTLNKNNIEISNWQQLSEPKISTLCRFLHSFSAFIDRELLKGCLSKNKHP